MRIAILGAKGIPCRDGGVERHVEELATRLSRRGHQVWVYARKKYNPNQHRATFQGARIVYTPYLATKNLETITHTFTSIIHLLFQKVDIIHIHSVGPSLLAFIPKLFKRKSKIVITFHSRDRFNKKWSPLAKIFLSLGEWTAANFPHALITVSKTLYLYCSEKYPGKKIFYLPNGATIFPRQKAKEIKKWGLAENNYILAVARLIPLKGIHYLISAFKKLNPNQKLVIVGASPDQNQTYEKYLRYQSRRNPNIIFIGHAEGKILAELFHNAYFYTLASEVEGLSISLLEAMASGKCVLVSDINENKEAIGQIGYTFKSKNIADLAQKMLFLINHPELVLKNGRQARERVQKYYHWPRIINQTIKLYRFLLNEDENRRKANIISKSKTLKLKQCTPKI